MRTRRRWPRILVVTDRRRLAAACGAAARDWPRLLAEQVRGALHGGADLVQVREPDLAARDLLSFMDVLRREQPASLKSIVVNDRVDLALLAGAAGVHLTERSLDEGDIESLPGLPDDWVVGRSVHGAEGAGRHRGVSYLLAGTVRATASKPAGAATLGWDGLAKIVIAAAETPVVAIGGLTEEDASRAKSAGAAGLAGIGCFLPQGRGEVAAMVQERVRRMRRAFDTTEAVPYTRRPAN